MAQATSSQAAYTARVRAHRRALPPDMTAEGRFVGARPACAGAEGSQETPRPRRRPTGTPSSGAWRGIGGVRGQVNKTRRD